MKNLTVIAKDYVLKHGVEATSNLIGKGASWVKNFTKGTQPSVVDLQLMIEHDPEVAGISSSVVTGPLTAPGILDNGFDKPMDDAEASARISPQIPPAMDQWPVGDKIAILMPTTRPLEIEVVKSLLSLYDKERMVFMYERPNMLPRGRNQLAQRFLDSGLPWAFWWDSDMVIPTGDADWFKKVGRNPKFPADYARLHGIGRLIQTAGGLETPTRKLVGGVYFARQEHGRAQFHEAYASNETNRVTHLGPRNAVEPTQWVATGCMLVHRDVFVDIAKTQPEVELKDASIIQALRYRYGFFTMEGDYPSEDIQFCMRAAKAGHQAFVDHAMMPLHMGETAYSYHNTQPAQGPTF